MPEAQLYFLSDQYYRGLEQQIFALEQDESSVSDS